MYMLTMKQSNYILTNFTNYFLASYYFLKVAKQYPQVLLETNKGRSQVLYLIRKNCIFTYNFTRKWHPKLWDIFQNKLRVRSSFWRHWFCSKRLSRILESINSWWNSALYASYLGHDILLRSVWNIMNISIMNINKICFGPPIVKAWHWKERKMNIVHKLGLNLYMGNGGSASNQRVIPS